MRRSRREFGAMGGKNSKWNESGRFPPQTLSFLAQLKRHNNRPWFQLHQEEYERHVKQPMQELVLRIGEAFQQFAPEMAADPKVSIYRVYRDTRFSPDKTPYKTHVAAVFPVRGLPKNSGPGLYFHVSPEEVLMGGGIYMPDPPLLRAVREHIAANPGKFLRIVEGSAIPPSFRRTRRRAVALGAPLKRSWGRLFPD